MVVTHSDFPAQLSIKFELSTIRKQTQSCYTSQEHNVRGSLRKGTAQKSTRSLGALRLAPCSPSERDGAMLGKALNTKSCVYLIKDRPLSLLYQILQTLYCLFNHSVGNFVKGGMQKGCCLGSILRDEQAASRSSIHGALPEHSPIAKPRRTPAILHTQLLDTHSHPMRPWCSSRAAPEASLDVLPALTNSWAQAAGFRRSLRRQGRSPRAMSPSTLLGQTKNRVNDVSLELLFSLQRKQAIQFFLSSARPR